MRRILVVALLGAACTVWSAVPLGGTGGWGVLLLVVASSCVVAGVFRLLLKDIAPPRGRLPMGLWAGLVDSTNAVLQGAAWEIGAALAVVVLEAVHGSRPWHTGLLAVLVVCYLLAVHQAESPVPVNLFRHHAKLLVISLFLVAVATGMAMVPSARSGALSGWLEVTAGLAAMTAGALALPL